MNNTQLIIHHHKEMTIREMSDAFRIRKECVCAILSQKGLKAKPGRVVINEDTKWQVKKLAPTHTIVRMMELLGLSKWQVRKILHDEKITSVGYKVNPEPTTESKYFNIDDWKDDKIFIG